MNEKIKELYVGQEFANYRRLCEFLGEEYKNGGQSKICQINDFKRFFSFDRCGNKYVITKIYNVPKEKNDKRCGSIWNNRKYPNLGIYNLTKEQGILKGVYKIQLDNRVYIGSTIVGFRARYRQHSDNAHNMSPHTHALLKEGASFEILWIANENDTEAIIRQKENDYIEQYTNNGYDMLNSNVPVIISEKRTVNSKKKPKYTNIRINKEDYEKAITLLSENGLRIAL